MSKQPSALALEVYREWADLPATATDDEVADDAAEMTGDLLAVIDAEIRPLLAALTDALLLMGDRAPSWSERARAALARAEGRAS